MENPDGQIFTTDVLIAGAGPAGLSAAIWCSDLGLTSALVAGNGPMGGQLRYIYNKITNYPGAVCANGAELADKLIGQLALTTGVTAMSGNVTGYNSLTGGYGLSTGHMVKAKCVVIATGVSRRRLNIAGEKEFEGRGILASGARSPGAVAGRDVAIIGGGDAALENVSMLAPFAKRVYLIHRGTELGARSEFIRQALELSNVEIVLGHAVSSIEGSTSIERIMVRNTASGELRQIEVDNVLIRIGVKPNSEPFEGLVATDGAGYVLIDSSCRTSVQGIYCAGDLASPLSPTIAGAVGQGATAAKAIYAFLNKQI